MLLAGQFHRAAISLVILFSLAASSKKFWYEERQLDLQIVRASLTQQFASFTIRLRNNGTAPVFLYAPVGMNEAASLDLDRQDGEKWVRI